MFWQLSVVIKKVPLSIWFGSIIIVLIFRIALFAWFRKTKVERKLEVYQCNLFILGSSLSAALWGIIGSLLMPMDIFYQVLIILMVSGIGGGAAISLGASYLASELYVVLSLVPIIIWVGIKALNGIQVYWGILIAMILYLFYASRAVRFFCYFCNAYFTRPGTALGFESSKNTLLWSKRKPFGAFV